MISLFKFIRREKYLFALSLGIFFVFFACGMVVSIFFPLKNSSPTGPFKEVYENPYLIQNPVYILRQNTLGFLMGFSGLVTLGISTFVFLSYNGATLGSIVGVAWKFPIHPLKILLFTISATGPKNI